MTDDALRIGDWRVVPSRTCLERDGRDIRIEPKAMDVLLCLAAAPGDVVSTEALISAVWGDRPMGDNPVYKCIAQLRKALGDDQQSPRYIENIPRKGYRLVAEVRPDDGNPSPPPAPVRRRTLWFMAGAVAVILVIALAFLDAPTAPAPDTPAGGAATGAEQVEPGRPSIAVLPFADMSAEGDQAYFAHGLAEEVLHTLARNPALKVIARSSSFSFEPSTTDIRTVAEALDVTHVLEGSVRKEGDRVRVTAQLIDASDSSHLWSEAFDATLEDVLELQYDIAERISRAMTPRMGTDLLSRGTALRPRDPRAYELYLEGRYYLDRFDVAEVQLARDRFQQALDIDPGYGAAWAGLADSYVALSYLAVLGPDEAADMTRAAAERALELDPNQAGAHAALGTVLTDHYYEWAAAEAHFKEALELNPSYSTGFQLYAEFLRDMGRFDEALSMIRKARELAPLSAFNKLVEGIVLDFERRHEEAVALYERVLELHPEFRMTHFYMGLALGHQGRLEAALASMERVDPRRRFPDAVSARGAFLAALGRRAEARAVLDELDVLADTRYVSPFLYAIILIPLGDHERALDMLEKTVEERSWFVRLFGIAPGLDPLRDHPRFRDLLANVGMASIEPATAPSDDAGIHADDAHRCDACEAWNEPLDPFRVFGNTWYVGTTGLSAILVVGRDGNGGDALVLLDGALTQSAPLIARNIEAIGFDLDDVRVILNSHAHFDHAGGIAALQRASGATVVASAAAAGALRTGQVPAHDPQAGFAPGNGFPAIGNVETLEDGGTLEVGDLELTLHETPGHAPGSTSWSWVSCEGTTCANVLYADSMGPVSSPGFRFSDPLPELDGASTAEVMRESIGFLRDFDCGVVLSPHPIYFHMEDKLAARDADPNEDAFLSSADCAALADRFQAALNHRLSNERNEVP